MAVNTNLDHVFAVILAGGSGTRFWPLSRRARPKQLLRLLGSKTLVEETARRICPLIPPERTFVYTSELVRRDTARLLSEIPQRQIVAEPASRNTAPSLGLAAHEILRRDPEGIMVVLPSDHIITKAAEFRGIIRTACRWAATAGRSVVLGLRPTRPETGYGYVKLGSLAGRAEGRDVYRVRKFTEKPTLPLARRYVRSRRYLWNGGMFIWRAQTLVENFKRFQPEMARGLEAIARSGGVQSRSVFKRVFPRLAKISIDYALMEKISEVYVVPADIGWSDVGSWTVAYDLMAKDRDRNVRPEHSLTLGTAGNLIFSPKKFVAAVGVQNLIVVETDDALLVCHRERSQDVGKAVQELEKRKRDDLL
ncbi:MAG: mannose-1-phosphate guanylyltransferase [Deltaproteobacteria bacterium]